MDDKELYERGLKLRVDMFGRDAVEKRMKAFGDFGKPLQHIINAYAYGDVWQRSALPPAVKSLAMVAMMAATGHQNELRVHLKGAVKNGCTTEQIQEVLLLLALYCGIPAANEAHRIAAEVLDESNRRRLGWRLGEQIGYRSPAYIVYARIVDALTVDLDQHRRRQIPAIECAEHHREVGALAVPSGLEVGAKSHLRGPLRAANLHRPATSCGSFQLHVIEFCLQGLPRLLECKTPVIQHVIVLRHANAAGDPVECRVLVGMQPYHVAHRQCQAANEDGDQRRCRRPAENARALEAPSACEPPKNRERRHDKDEMP